MAGSQDYQAASLLYRRGGDGDLKPPAPARLYESKSLRDSVWRKSPLPPNPPRSSRYPGPAEKGSGSSQRPEYPDILLLLLHLAWIRSLNRQDHWPEVKHRSGIDSTKIQHVPKIPKKSDRKQLFSLNIKQAGQGSIIYRSLWSSQQWPHWSRKKWPKLQLKLPKLSLPISCPTLR